MRWVKELKSGSGDVVSNAEPQAVSILFEQKHIKIASHHGGHIIGRLCRRMLCFVLEMRSLTRALWVQMGRELVMGGVLVI